MEFKQFITESEKSLDDIKDTLKKLPKSHKKLLDGFTYEFQPGNTMKGDNGHVGMIDGEKKKITLAAPHFYSREFTFLHELGHMVWVALLTPEQKKEWAKISKENPNTKKENDEENFCMAYACHYSKHHLTTYHLKSWMNFIKKISK